MHGQPSMAKCITWLLISDSILVERMSWWDVRAEMELDFLVSERKLITRMSATFPTLVLWSFTLGCRVEPRSSPFWNADHWNLSLLPSRLSVILSPLESAHSFLGQYRRNDRYCYGWNVGTRKLKGGLRLAIQNHLATFVKVMLSLPLILFIFKCVFPPLLQHHCNSMSVHETFWSLQVLALRRFGQANYTRRAFWPVFQKAGACLSLDRDNAM